jgi:hypothetical protein
MTEKEFRQQAVKLNDVLLDTFTQAYLCFAEGQTIEAVTIRQDIILAGSNIPEPTAKMHRRMVRMARGALACGVPLRMARADVLSMFQNVEDKIVQKGLHDKCQPDTGS